MAARKTKSTKADRTELIEALNAIEKEKQISKDIILEAIENSLLAACKNQFGKSENIRVNIDRETGEVKVFADYEVVEDDMMHFRLELLKQNCVFVMMLRLVRKSAPR